MTPKLVIFDCDGVLVDSEPATDRAVSANLSRYGLDISPAQASALFTGGTIASVGDEARARGATLPANWVDEMYGEMFDVLRQGVDLIDGVVALLDRLTEAGIATAIASNGSVEKMQITLPPVGLWDRFEGRIYSGHDHGPKPAPDMVLRIMADQGVSAQDTVMIDDSVKGCLSGINAGVRCLGFVETRDPAPLLAIGAEPARHMDNIAALIGLV